MTLTQAFETELLVRCQKATTLGCATTRMTQAISQYGAVAFTQELLRRGRVSDSFDQLSKLGRLDLTLEATVVDPKFGDLFTDEEVNGCYKVLVEGGYFG